MCVSNYRSQRVASCWNLKNARRWGKKCCDIARDQVAVGPAVVPSKKHKKPTPSPSFNAPLPSQSNPPRCTRCDIERHLDASSQKRQLLPHPLGAFVRTKSLLVLLSITSLHGKRGRDAIETAPHEPLAVRSSLAIGTRRQRRQIVVALPPLPGQEEQQ